MIDHAHGFEVQQHAEIKHDDDGDEALEQQQEFALGDEIGFAGLVDQLGNFAHRAVHRQILQAHEDGESEDQSEDAEEDAEQQELVAVDAEEIDLREIREAQVGLTARGFRRGLGHRCGRAGRNQRSHDYRKLCETAGDRANARPALRLDVRQLNRGNRPKGGAQHRVEPDQSCYRHASSILFGQ